MVRFFVSKDEMTNSTIILSGENAAHAKVLRLKVGEEVLACDGDGRECLCEVAGITGNEYELRVISSGQSINEPRVKVSIFMALPKSDKLEHVIQKATELGASEIVTFPSARCVSRPDDKGLKKKLERWQKIAVSAAEQSGRGRIPTVVVLATFKDALQLAAQAEKAIVFYENEHATTLRQALSTGEYHTVSLLSGPEGGFEDNEIEQARQMGMQVCTLGRRILRCETAPLCGLSAVMYDSGEF